MEYRLKTGARRTAVMLLVTLSVALVLALTLASHSALAAGGPFSAKYSGTYASSLTGSGTATFLGASSMTSQFHCGSGSCLASATLTSTTHPTNSLNLSLFCLKPCPNPIHWHYNVKSGTGAFAKATGGGTAIYTLSGAGTGTFKATFSGTLTF